MEFGVGVGEWWVRGQESGVSSWSSELELGLELELELELAAERRPGRGDAACSPRTPRGESFGCKHFSKKFVIDCHWAHTFTWLNLLLEPKRHLQRFGFVFLGDASFCGFSHKGLVGVRSWSWSWSWRVELAAERRSERRDAAYSPRDPEEEPSAVACEKKFKIFLSSSSSPCI